MGKRKNKVYSAEFKIGVIMDMREQRLRMEIEYFKKLSALVLAEERENGKKQK